MNTTPFFWKYRFTITGRQMPGSTDLTEAQRNSCDLKTDENTIAKIPDIY